MNFLSNTIVGYAVSYLLFFLFLWKCKAIGSLRLFDQKGFVSDKRMLLLLHVFGIILFGIIPNITHHPAPANFFQPVDLTLLSTWASVLLVVCTIYFSLRIAAKKYSVFPADWDYKSVPNIVFLLFYFVIRVSFICCYETWFRGYLLNDSVAWFGIYWAILLNVILYSILHIVNGREEALGSIPFGILLCFLILWQGSVWPAILIHLALSLPYEFSVIKKNESLKISSK